MLKGRLNGSVIVLISANVFMLGLLYGLVVKERPKTQQVCKDVWYYMDGAITATVEADHRKPILRLYERHGSHETPLGIFQANLTKQFDEGKNVVKYWGKNFELAIIEDPTTYMTGFPARLTAVLNDRKIKANLGCRK